MFVFVNLSQMAGHWQHWTTAGKRSGRSFPKRGRAADVLLKGATLLVTFAAGASLNVCADLVRKDLENCKEQRRNYMAEFQNIAYSKWLGLVAQLENRWAIAIDGRVVDVHSSQTITDMIISGLPAVMQSCKQGSITTKNIIYSRPDSKTVRIIICLS